MKTRMSYQRGWIETRKKAGGGRIYVARWWERDPESATGWTKKSRSLPKVTSLKEAQKQLDLIIAEVNDPSGVEVPTEVPTTLEEFVEKEWQVYVSNRDLKPSTRYSYSSSLKNHVLPNLGKQALSSIAPDDLAHLFRHLSDT